jgi:hypothetical protein
MTINGFQLEARHGTRGRVWEAAPWERFEARGVIATAIALAALTAAAGAGGAVASGAIGAHAAGSAANTAAGAQTAAMQTQLQAEREATAAQTAASDKQLAYNTQQAALARQDAETNREGDYASWAAREGRLGTIGEALGLPARQIPAFRPLGADPSAGGSSGAPVSAATLPKQGEVDWTAAPDKLGQQLTGYFTSRGVNPGEVPYWVSKAAELVQRGQQLNDPAYADKRLAAADVFGAIGGRPAAAPAGSIASMTPGYQAPLTPPVMAAQAPVPGSIRALAA